MHALRPVGYGVGVKAEGAHPHKGVRCCRNLWGGDQERVYGVTVGKVR